MFTRTGGSWSELTQLVAGAGENDNGGLGASVAISADGSTIAVGAPDEGRLSVACVGHDHLVGMVVFGAHVPQVYVLGDVDARAVGAEQDLRNQWAEAIWRFVYGSYRHLNMINADPHPGNYLFHDDGRVSFLDFGCVPVIAATPVVIAGA